MYSDFSVYQKEYEKYDVLSELDYDNGNDVMYVDARDDGISARRQGYAVCHDDCGGEKRQDFFNEQDRFHMGEVRELFMGGPGYPKGLLYFSCAVPGISPCGPGRIS